MTNTFRWENPGVTGALTILLLFLAVLTGIGLFAWWAFSFSTHTLVWLIFVFGSVLGSVRIRASK